MALRLDFKGQLGRRDRQLAGFVASHIKNVMTDKYKVFPVNVPGVEPYYLLEPWWPIYDRSHKLLSRMMTWAAAAAIVLPALAACVAAFR